jgi:hypothetical protein
MRKAILFSALTFLLTAPGCGAGLRNGIVYSESATFGEFDSGGEGGRSIKLTVSVPEGIRVERDDTHEMKRSDIVRTTQG